MKWSKKRIIVFASIILLVGGITAGVVRVAEHNRAVQVQKQPALKAQRKRQIIKRQAKERQKVALWVVQHFEGPEPITQISVGKIQSYGIGGTGGYGTSVMINNRNNVLNGLGLDEDSKPQGDYQPSEKFAFTYHKNGTGKNLQGVKVTYWEGH